MMFYVVVFVTLVVTCSGVKREYLKNVVMNEEQWNANCAAWQYYSTNGFSICERTEYNKKCNLKTAFYNVENASRLFVEITTKTDICKYRNFSLCEDQLSLGIYKGNKSTIPKSFIDLDKLPTVAVGNNATFLHTDVLAIDDAFQYEGIQLQFHAKYYCGWVKNISIYYYMCPTAVTQLLTFPSIPAPNKNQTMRKLFGTCSANAIPITRTGQPFLECFYNGTYKVNGLCTCDRGYTKIGTKCIGCAFDKYKPEPGNRGCYQCGKNSVADDYKESCVCNKDHFKAIGTVGDPQAECYGPPKPPTNVKVTGVKNYEAVVSWTRSQPGTSVLGSYILRCTNCPKDLPGFPMTTDDTKIDLKDLGAYTTYYLTLTNENNVTNITGHSLLSKFNFTTLKGAPGPIKCGFETNPDGSVTFKWDPPFARGGDNPQYIVTYGDKVLKLKERSFTIETGLQDKTYTVKIKTEVVVDKLPLTGPECRKSITVKGGIPLTLALGVSFGIIIFIAVALVAAFCIWKRRNPAYLQVVRMEDGSVKVPVRFYNGGKIYVDPKSYADVNEAVSEFAYEIDRGDLRLMEKIGEGEFAEVYRGELNRSGKQVTVAVKILKANATRSDRNDFLSEAAIAGQFSDLNVIMLEGVILKDEPNAIILEYMIHGALDKYLQDNDMQFTVIELLYMARGIASGMKYLSEMGFIHRDLAARNILVDENKICKIADFGMSLEIKMDESSESKSGKIPVRWTAPEAIQFKKFTTASDVWSYGIVLWEVMSYGERPYWEWTNYEVLEQVTRGYRLSPPMGCPRVVHDLMLQCWNKDRTKRLLFSTIRDRIDDWLDNPTLLEDMAPIMRLDENLDYTIMQTINKWLQAIDMGRYAINFIEQGFATPRQILLLKIDDLETLGIGNIEHQKRIAKAIENTKAQVEAQMKRGGSIISNGNTKDKQLQPHDL